MTNIKTLTPPADLDPARLHSPAEVDIWKAQWETYREAVKDEEARELLKERNKEAHENRFLNRDEYHALALQREAERQAKEVARQAAEKAKQDEEAAYLASLPDVAEVCEANEFLFLVRCQHWMTQGYAVAEDSISYFIPGCYAVRLHKPTATKRSKQ